MPARWPPLLYFAFAHVCLALALAVAAVRPAEIAGFYYHPRLVALVHLVTLGWVSSSILGALYLVAPLTFRVVLPGSGRDVAAFAVWAIAVSGVASHFWLDTLAGVAWAGLLAMIVMIFVGGRVLRRMPTAPVPLEARLPVMCAVINVLLAALLGVALGVNKTHPFLRVSQLDGVVAHAHLAGLGWGVLMVMGAGYRLLPMMLPSAVPRGAAPIAATALTQLGAWLLVLARLAAAPPAVLALAAIIGAAGVALFLILVVWMLRHPRPAPAAQPRPDVGVAHALQALGWLAVSSAVGVWLALAPASEATLAGAMAYGVLALVGFLAQVVVGVSARLLPLYAWLWGFADRGHQASPPSLHHALSRPIQMVTLALWTAGVPLLAVALARDLQAWISVSAGALSVAVVLGGANLTLGVWRLWTTTPTAPRPSPSDGDVAARPVHDATQDHAGPTDAYRVFFPLGIVLGMAGVSIWLAYGLGLTAGYSGRAHAFVQVEGFLYAFIAGFLLTALPRFTGTAPPSRTTQYLLAAAVAATSVGFEMEAFAFSHTLFLIVHATVIVLAVRRVRRRRSSPPEGFALVGFGMFAGAAGALVNVAVSWSWATPEWDLLGRRLLTEGMVLLLVLGVGGFLGPRLLGFATLPEFQKLAAAPVGQRPPLLVGKRGAAYVASGLAILLSVVFEYGLALGMWAFVRAGLATLLILGTIKPWRLPAVRTTLAWCVWWAHWLLLAGLWLVALAPSYRVDLLHVIFMGGFTLLILAVAMRVTLSHGGHALSHERRSWPLRIGIATGLLALLARLAAAFAPESFFEHLAVAAFLWIAGIVFWGVHIAQYIRRRSLPTPKG